jgi:hypothetical protein
MSMARMFIYIPFLCLVIFSIVGCDEKLTTIKDNSRLEIIFVDKDIMTPFSISCEHFENYFNSSTKKIIVENRDEIAKIQNCLKKERENPDVPDIDVRVKVGFYESDSLVALYCFDRFGNIIFDNKLPLRNRCFVDIINERISGSGKND